MSRIKYKKVSADDGEEVPDDHIVKGYEFSKGQYVVVEPDELEQFMPVATHSIDLEEFVDLADIDPMFFDTAYYLAPDKVTKPYTLLVKAMEEAGKVAVGRFVMRNKQHVGAIRAVDGHLVLSTMVYADEVVKPAAIDEFEGLEDVEVTAKELKMAEQLVESLAGPFEPEKYQDELSGAGARPHRQEGRGRGARGARARGDRAEGRRPAGGAGGEREGGQGEPHAPPYGGATAKAAKASEPEETGRGRRRATRRRKSA